MKYKHYIIEPEDYCYIVRNLKTDESLFVTDVFVDAVNFINFIERRL